MLILVGTVARRRRRASGSSRASASRSAGWRRSSWSSAGSRVWNGYFILFEGLRRGQTPGKRVAGIRVVMDTGHPVTFGAAAARNLLRVADFLPPPYLIGLLLVAFHPRGKRLGDLVAGTVVARDRPQERARRAARPRLPRTPRRRFPSWTTRTFRLLSQFAAATGRPGPGRADPAGRRTRGPRLADHPAAAGAERRGPPPRPARRRAGPPPGRLSARGAAGAGHPVRGAEAASGGTSSSGWPSGRRARDWTASRRTSSPTSPRAIARSPPTWPGRAPIGADAATQARLERLAAAGPQRALSRRARHLAPTLDRARPRVPGGRRRGPAVRAASRS